MISIIKESGEPKDIIIDSKVIANYLFNTVKENPIEFMNGINAAVCELLRVHKKIAAIKLVRLITGVSLKDAKFHCDELEDSLETIGYRP